MIPPSSPCTRVATFKSSFLTKNFNGLAGLLVPGLVDQDAAHRLSGCREEVSPMVPAINIAGADQAQIGLMYQSRRLERLPHLRGLTSWPPASAARYRLAAATARPRTDRRIRFGTGCGKLRTWLDEPGRNANSAAQASFAARVTYENRALQNGWLFRTHRRRAAQLDPLMAPTKRLRWRSHCERTQTLKILENSA